MALAQDVAGSQRKARKRRRVAPALGCGEEAKGTRNWKGGQLGARQMWKGKGRQAAQAGVGAVAGAAEAAAAEGERAHWRKQ